MFTNTRAYWLKKKIKIEVAACYFIMFIAVQLQPNPQPPDIKNLPLGLFCLAFLLVL